MEMAWRGGQIRYKKASKRVLWNPRQEATVIRYRIVEAMVEKKD